MVEYPAHIRKDGNTGETTEQSVQEHLRRAAEYAGIALCRAGLAESGYLCGLVHDMGKFTADFRAYIREEANASVIHSFQAVKYLLERFHAEKYASLRDVACELLAYAVGAHHGEFDAFDENGESGFERRMRCGDMAYEEAARNFEALCAEPAEVARRFEEADREIEAMISRAAALAKNSETKSEDRMFYIGCVARLLLSAVVEGDRRDTARFMNLAAFPESPEDMRPLWENGLIYMERKLNALPCGEPVPRARRGISDLCAGRARLPPGAYRLTVPTGGGKTLTALRFALAHARAHNMARIFFVMPLLAITEQNAGVIREYLGDTLPVLEHHSNAVRAVAKSDALDPRELLCETWEAPVIVTTLVQLLLTMFSAKTGCIRRFHALCGSVIVIDEVQTIPSRMLSQFNLMVNFLCGACGATVLLCSATQPCLEAVRHPIRGVRELVEEDLSLRPEFQRTRIEPQSAMSKEDMALWVARKMEAAHSMLVVCNTRAEAKGLYDALSGLPFRRVHMSAAMCAAHRMQAMEKIKRANEKTLCVSTQVMQAGVDVSFDCAARILAGMDSAVQTAGRCNRHGENPDAAPVYILPLLGEKLSAFLRDIREGQLATEGLLAEYETDGELQKLGLSSSEAIYRYYRRLFSAYPQGRTEYSIGSDSRATMLDLLSMNLACAPKAKTQYFLRQAFKTAGARFTVFDADTTDVLVPYGKGREIISLLGSARAEHDLSLVAQLLQDARPYTVGLYAYEFKRLLDLGGIAALEKQGAYIVKEGFYSEETGVNVFGELEFCEVR